MRVISHPFRLDHTGAVATVLDGSTDAHAEAIAVTTLTRRGERPLVPDFGVADPAFGTVDAAELAATIDTYGPEGVRIVDVVTTYPDARTADVRIEFEEE